MVDAVNEFFGSLCDEVKSRPQIGAGAPPPISLPAATITYDSPRSRLLKSAYMATLATMPNALNKKSSRLEFLPGEKRCRYSRHAA